MPTPPDWNNGDGSIPEPPDGVIRDENGNTQDRGNRNGSTDRQQDPRTGRPDDSTDEPQAPDEPSGDTDTQTQRSWFQNLWQTIKNWFSGLFGK